MKRRNFLTLAVATLATTAFGAVAPYPPKPIVRIKKTTHIGATIMPSIDDVIRNNVLGKGITVSYPTEGYWNIVVNENGNGHKLVDISDTLKMEIR